MKYKPLGRTGLYVSELTLGAMTFASEDGPFAAILGGTGHKGAQKMIDISLEAGINIIDTSNMYSFGESEEIIGKALGDRRKDVVVATKVYFPLGTKPNDLGVSRLAIMREVENSLKRLKPTTSICIRCIITTKPRRWKKPCAQWMIWCARGKFVTSVCPISPPGKLPKRTVFQK